MSIDSTNPVTQIGDRAGNAATLKKDGINTYQEISAPGLEVLLKQILAKLIDVEEAIQELDNI